MQHFHIKTADNKLHNSEHPDRVTFIFICYQNFPHIKFSTKLLQYVHLCGPVDDILQKGGQQIRICMSFRMII